jgi:hypothetical protein
MGKTKKKFGGNKEKYVFLTDKITTQPNTDDSYKEIGIIHLTESDAINIIRGFATGVSNIFGAKGFDNSLIDSLRNSTLNRLNGMIEPDQKVCNLRMEIDSSNPKLVFHHVYGTLFKKTKIDIKNNSL